MRLQRPPRFRRVCRRPSDSHPLPTPTHWLPLGGHRHSVPRERASRTPGLEVAKKVQDNIKNHPAQSCGFRRPCAPLRAASLLARGVCVGVCARVILRSRAVLCQCVCMCMRVCVCLCVCECVCARASCTETCMWVMRTRTHVHARAHARTARHGERNVVLSTHSAARAQDQRCDVRYGAHARPQRRGRGLCMGRCLRWPA